MEQTNVLHVKNETIQASKTAEPSPLSLHSKQVSSHLIKIRVKVGAQVCHILREHTVRTYQRRAHSPGLKEVPLSYVEKNYCTDINNDLEKLLYRYFVIDYLCDELVSSKVLLVNDPRLEGVSVVDSEFIFSFAISVADAINLREWKNFAFKPPRRKNYKDLDKQVESFIKMHQDRARKSSLDVIEENDWVYFSARLIDTDNSPLLALKESTYWMKATIDTLRHPLVEDLLGKRVGETIFTDQFSLIHDFSQSMQSQQRYALTVSAITKGTFLVIDSIKQMFRLPNKAAIHDKIIEIFSYRNDLSQRRCTIEEMFHLFFSKHRFEVPKHLVLRKQEELLIGLKRRPDYHAYRQDKNFLKNLALLAEQQLKEEILIDQIATHEKIKADAKDIAYYLNVLSDDRAREFIYFRANLDGMDDYPAPIQTSALNQICRREKTLNYILHHLTR